MADVARSSVQQMFQDQLRALVNKARDPLAESDYARTMRGLPPAPSEPWGPNIFDKLDTSVDSTINAIPGAIGNSLSRDASGIGSAVTGISDYARRSVGDYPTGQPLIPTPFMKRIGNQIVNLDPSSWLAQIAKGPEAPNTLEPKSPDDGHKKEVEAAKASAAEGISALKAKKQPSDQQAQDMITMLGAATAAQHGASIDDKPVWDTIQAHAKQTLDGIPPEKKIDMLSAGLGILEGMGNRQTPFAGVLGAGLKQGVEAATQDRQRAIMNQLAAVNSATNIEQVQQQSDQNKELHNLANSTAEQNAAFRQAEIRIKEANAESNRIRANRPVSGGESARNAQLHAHLASVLNTMGIQNAGNDLKENETAGSKFADLGLPAYTAALQASGSEEVAIQAAIQSIGEQTGHPVEYDHEWTGNNKVQVDPDKMGRNAIEGSALLEFIQKNSNKFLGSQGSSR